MYSGRRPIYENWRDGFPNNDVPNPSCVIMDSDYGSESKWRNFYCNEHKALGLCELKITPSTISETTTKATTTTTSTTTTTTSTTTTTTTTATTTTSGM